MYLFLNFKVKILIELSNRKKKLEVSVIYLSSLSFKYTTADYTYFYVSIIVKCIHVFAWNYVSYKMFENLKVYLKS